MKKVIGIMGKAGSGKSTTADILSDIMKRDGVESTKYSFADPLKDMCSFVFDIPIQCMYDQELKKKDIIINPSNKIVRSNMEYWVDEYIRDKDRWSPLLIDPKFSGKSSTLNRTEEFADHLLKIFVDILDRDSDTEKLGWHNKLYEYYSLTIRRLLQLVGTELIRNNLDQKFWSDIKDDDILMGDEYIIIPDCRFESEVDLILNKCNGSLFVIDNPTITNTMDHESEKFVDEVDGYFKENKNIRAYTNDRLHHIENPHISLDDLASRVSKYYHSILRPNL